jgi:hypothetical protein
MDGPTLAYGDDYLGLYRLDVDQKQGWRWDVSRQDWVAESGLYEAWLVDDLFDKHTIGEDEIEDVKAHLQARDHP